MKSLKETINESLITEHFVNCKNENEMKQLNNYIIEKLKINSTSNVHKYLYHPHNKDELIEIIDKLIDENGDDANLNDIDVREITDMSSLFSYKKNFNCDISAWDMSNVKNINYMFVGCTDFNSDISNWDVSNVEEMHGLFAGCNKFNQDLSNWNVLKVTNMYKMFYGCENFEGKGLDKWDVSNVRNMSQMFYRCKNFEGKELENWKLNSVNSISFMFYDCENLNCNLSKWKFNKHKSVEMKCTFNGCKKITKPKWYKNENN